MAASYIVDTGLWAEAPPWAERRPDDRRPADWKAINPVGFHLANVLFHALNALLVFALARALIRRHDAALFAGLSEEQARRLAGLCTSESFEDAVTDL